MKDFVKRRLIMRPRVNTLLKLAEKYERYATDEEAIEKDDITNLFYRQLEYMIKNGEILIININAKMRKGKSTAGFALGNWILKTMQKHGKAKQKKPFGMKNIARDQMEHVRMMLDSKTNHTVIVTDEINKSAQTRENSSTEAALEEDLSNVQASRYVHRVMCSPRDIIDANADILLDIIAAEKGITTCKVYYRYQKRS